MSSRNTESRGSAPPHQATVQLVSSADLPTRNGPFKILAFCDDEGREYATLVRGELAGAENVLVRLHSQCLTGDALGSIRCDCRAQLEASMDALGRAERGVLIYLPQEGRGIGLCNKIRAYSLQDLGMDTVEANIALGFPNDMRSYDEAAVILRTLGVASVHLLTNNPDKVDSLVRNGIRVTERVPLVVGSTPQNRRYLDTKRRKCGHML